jgi:tungstate transport system permease protein
MESILEAFVQAVGLFARGDPELWRVTLLSLYVSGISTMIAMLLGIPFGYLLAFVPFPGRGGVITIINTGMALPPVLVGLAVFLLISYRGPLGYLSLLYSPTAMIIAQTIIAFPVVAALALAGLQQIDPGLYLQTRSLGATPFQSMGILIGEAKLALAAAVIAGFGSVISEVGAVMMVGGNIEGQTRVLTTAIVMETHQGNFAQAAALGILLLLLTLVINLALTFVQQQGRRR